MDAELERVLRSHRRAIEDKNDELDALRSRLTEAEGLLREWTIDDDGGACLPESIYARSRAFLSRSPSSTPPPVPALPPFECCSECKTETACIYSRDCDKRSPGDEGGRR